jgi:hypothetical protein
MSPTDSTVIEETKNTVKLFMQEWGFDALKLDGQYMNALLRIMVTMILIILNNLLRKCLIYLGKFIKQQKLLNHRQWLNFVLAVM